MHELGKKGDLSGVELLEPIQSGKLQTWPQLKKGFDLVCGYDQGLGERMIVCENMDDVKILNDGYSKGNALSIKWYQGPDTGFIHVI